MFPFAHVATATTVNRTAFHDDQDLIAASGALLPDAIDKTLCWVLGITKNSHHIGHSAVGALTLSALFTHWFGAEKGRLFAAAYTSHLLGDELHHGRVPWFLPFTSWTRLPHRKNTARRNAFLLLEFPAMLILVLQNKNRLAFLRQFTRSQSS